MNIKCILKYKFDQQFNYLQLYAMPMCVCTVCVQHVGYRFQREPVQCRPQPISEGGSPVFNFQLHMEDAGNRKPLLVLLNFLSNNITDHLLNKFTICCCYENESGPIFKSRSPLTSNDSIILTKLIYYSIKVSECII